MSHVSRPILVSALAAISAFALSACGQKGDLYLPPAAAATAAPAVRASAPVPPASAASANTPNPAARP
ncbi:MAG: LPS translocon maturation chaperone LptM [Ramlibacter sp.]